MFNLKCIISLIDSGLLSYGGLGGPLLNLIPTLPVGHQEAQIGSDSRGCRAAAALPTLCRSYSRHSYAFLNPALLPNMSPFQYESITVFEFTKFYQIVAKKRT